MFRNDNEELQNFKRRIDLVQLAQSYGYSVVRKESCRTSVVMKNEANASKIIVATAQDGHGIFFEVHGDASGSAIDFVMYRESCSLGNVRKILREWLGQPRPDFVKEYTKPLPSHVDHLAVLDRWRNSMPYKGDYLRNRHITDETVALFSEHIHLVPSVNGRYQNIGFLHQDEDGLTGWEEKNNGYNGFPVSCQKGIFSCQVGEAGQPSRIVICESAIDTMSYYQLCGKKPGLYISIGGNMSPKQETLLRTLLTTNSQAKIITATDADAQGEKYAVMIHAIRPDAIRSRPGLKSRPGERFKDWNDVLMDRPMPPKPRGEIPEQKPHQDIDRKPSRTPSYDHGRPDLYQGR